MSFCEIPLQQHHCSYGYNFVYCIIARRSQQLYVGSIVNKFIFFVKCMYTYPYKRKRVYVGHHLLVIVLQTRKLLTKHQGQHARNSLAKLFRIFFYQNRYKMEQLPDKKKQVLSKSFSKKVYRFKNQSEYVLEK